MQRKQVKLKGPEEYMAKVKIVDATIALSVGAALLKICSKEHDELVSVTYPILKRGDFVKLPYALCANGFDFTVGMVIDVISIYANGRARYVRLQLFDTVLAGFLLNEARKEQHIVVDAQGLMFMGD